MALVFLGMPVLMLEICIGQAYRGGCLIAYDHINKRTKGVGMAVVFNGYAIVVVSKSIHARRGTLLYETRFLIAPNLV